MTERRREPLIELRDVKVHFPIKSGLLFDRTVGYVYAVDGVVAEHPQGRDVRPGRRVGLRQVDARSWPAAARRADRRRDRLRRHRRRAR